MEEEIINRVKGKRGNTHNKGSVSKIYREHLQIKKKMESNTIETFFKDTKHESTEI